MTTPNHDPRIDDIIAPDDSEPTNPNDVDPSTPEEGHEGATDEQVGDRKGPGAGYDQEPEKVKDKGGVS